MTSLCWRRRRGHRGDGNLPGRVFPESTRRLVQPPRSVSPRGPRRLRQLPQVFRRLQARPVLRVRGRYLRQDLHGASSWSSPRAERGRRETQHRAERRRRRVRRGGQAVPAIEKEKGQY